MKPENQIMAASTPTTSRRSALRCFTFATLAAGRAVPMRSHAATALEHLSQHASGEDAELIAAGAEATRCEAWRCGINDVGGVSDEEAAIAGSEWIEAFECVAELPATTPVGIRAKALALRQAVLEFVLIGPDRTLQDDGDTNHRLAVSLCDDLLAGSTLASSTFVT
jgi:hypothetical protein